MSLSFPASPTVGQIYTEGNRQWTWDGVAWYASTPAITAQPADPDLTAIAALSGAGLAARTAPDTWALRQVAAGDGIAVANPDGAAGNPSVAVNSTVVRTTRTITAGTGLTGGGDLTENRSLALTGQALALHNFALTGLMVRTGAAAFTARSVVGGDGVDVTNGSGVSGNPSVAVDSSVVRTTRMISTGAGLTGGGNLSSNRTLALTGQALAFHELGGLGIVVKTGEDAASVRAIVGGDGIDITNGIAVAGNPTITVDSSVVRTSLLLTAGNGLTGGGYLSGNRTFTLGTPGSITKTSINSVSASSHTHALASSTIMSMIADGAHGDVGSYAFLRRSTTNTSIVRGNDYAGSTLRYAGISTRDDQQNSDVEGTWNDAPPGTWKAMGTISAVTGRYSMTLFLRVS